MLTVNPEAVVFMIGTNDANVVNSFDADDDGVADWEVDYRNRVAAMMDLLANGPAKRTVIWIGAPTMRDPDRDDAVVELNRVMREEAAKRGPAVVYLDAYQLFGDENGDYTASVDTGTTNERVRIGDGVHFTPAGAEYLAEPVMSLLEQRYNLSTQADPSRPIAVTIADGGESTSGTGRSNGSADRDGSDDDENGDDDNGGSGGSGGSGRRTPRTTAPVEDEPQTPPPSAAPEPTTPPATSPPATQPPEPPSPPDPGETPGG